MGIDELFNDMPETIEFLGETYAKDDKILGYGENVAVAYFQETGGDIRGGAVMVFYNQGQIVYTPDGQDIQLICILDNSVSVDTVLNGIKQGERFVNKGKVKGMRKQRLVKKPTSDYSRANDDDTIINAIRNEYSDIFDICQKLEYIGTSKRVKSMKKGTKKSLLTDGDHGNPWYFSGDSSGEQFFINGIEYFVEPNPYEQDGYTVFPVTQVLEDGEWETICVIREGMSVEEIEELVIDNTIRESTRKSINIKNKGRDTMGNVKKNTLLKELEDIDEECEGKDCEDKKEETFRRATRKDEEPDSKKPLQEEISADELREKCARAKKRHLARTSRKGMRKADSAEPTGTIVNEVADPEELVSGGESAEPKETIVDEVESPEELDDETHGAEPEETVVNENVDPEQLDKIRRAKIRRALAKRRMQKARQESARKSPRQVRKFSVATRGSERYDGKQNYNQSPMMREAIDRQFPKEDETVKSLNARLDAIRRQSRNKVSNPIGKKRLH